MLPKNPNATVPPPVPPTAGGEEPATLQPVQQAAAGPPGSTRSPFLTPGSLVVLGMFAIGMTGIYVLSLRIGPATALGEQNSAHAKVENALNALAAMPTAADAAQKTSAKAIVAEFYTAARQRQVGLRGLTGNPFVFVDPRPPATEPNDVPAPEQITPPEPDGKQQALAALKTLKLQTIMVGSTSPMALISSNLVTTGQTIGGWTIEKITPRQVHLRWKDLAHVLEIQQ